MGGTAWYYGKRSRQSFAVRLSNGPVYHHLHLVRLHFELCDEWLGSVRHNNARLGSTPRAWWVSFIIIECLLGTILSAAQIFFKKLSFLNAILPRNRDSIAKRETGKLVLNCYYSIYCRVGSVYIYYLRAHTRGRLPLEWMLACINALTADLTSGSPQHWPTTVESLDVDTPFPLPLIDADRSMVIDQ